MDIEDIIDDFDEFIEEEVIELALDIYSHAVKISPVKTNTYRGSWRVSPNQIDTSTGRDVKSEQAIKTSLKSTYSLKDDLWISNSVEYTNEIENGHSKQAPKGVLKNAVFFALNKRK